MKLTISVNFFVMYKKKIMDSDLKIVMITCIIIFKIFYKLYSYLFINI